MKIAWVLVLVLLLSVEGEANVARGLFALSRWVTNMFVKLGSKGVDVTGAALKGSTRVLARSGVNLARGTAKGAKYLARPAVKVAKKGRRVVYRTYQRVGGIR